MPTSYEEAMLEQHVDISAALTKLVSMLAECDIGDDNSKILKLFEDALHNAKTVQNGKGAEARWRRVHWKKNKNKKLKKGDNEEDKMSISNATL